MPNETELETRIQQLEAENARLKSGKARPVEYAAREDMYEGHPVLVFEGPLMRRSFTVGVSKLKTIKACWHRVDEFLAKHDKPKPGRNGNSHPSTEQI